MFALAILLALLGAFAITQISAYAMGAPTENYTIPDPVGDDQHKEIRPPVNFILQGPSAQHESSTPGLTAGLWGTSAAGNLNISGNEQWYLDVDINTPGWLYIYEYYPLEGDNQGRWIAYKWQLEEPGQWRLGPFRPGENERAGQHIYRFFFYGNGQWAAGGGAQKSSLVYWNYDKGANTLEILAFEANPRSVVAGQSTELSWDVPGSESIEISGIGSVARPSGTIMATPAASTTYTLTARGLGDKTLSASVAVTVQPVSSGDQLLKFVTNPVTLLVAPSIIVVMVLLGWFARRSLRERRYLQNAEHQPLVELLEQPSAPSQSRVRSAAVAILELSNGLKIKLGGESEIIGRSQVARALTLDELGAISKQHFRISFEDGKPFIEDMGSTNGTTVNGRDIQGAGPVGLHDGDVIEMAGRASLKFRAD
jgi:hypothetical protein